MQLCSTALPCLCLLVSILFSFLVVCLFRWLGSRDSRLPPGSMGWPYLGETRKLYTQNPNTFFSTRLNGYGEIFKTHILGCPCVMVSTPEVAKTVLVKRAHLFKPKYPPSKERLIGPEALFFHQGQYHSRLRKLVQSSFLPAAIRGSVPEIEKIILSVITPWENTTINTLKEMKKLAFNVAMLSVFGGSSESDIDIDKEGIRNLYLRVEKGYNSMPINFPGTPFRRAMKARNLLNDTLRKEIGKRRGNQTLGGGLLGVLLGHMEQKFSDLTEPQVADNIIGVIFAAQDTTASVLTWILKYLHDNKQVLESVTREQEKIRRTLNEKNRGLTWDDTRKMLVTNRVIQETLRTSSILSFTFREAVEDVHLQGYLIPKGWKVLPVFRSIHHCAEFFPQPEKFDPSRFEVPLRPNTFMPFGNGVHSCPGNELAKLEMLILLHHLTTMYRWEAIGKEEGVQYGPFPVPKKGLPLSITKKGTDES